MNGTQRKPIYRFQDGDNWLQLLNLRESEITKNFGDRVSKSTLRDVVINKQHYVVFLPKTANSQLQQCIQTVLATGKNPLEFTYNIRRNREGNQPIDVSYQVITGEWVGLAQGSEQRATRSAQHTDYSQPQNTPSPTPPIVRSQQQYIQNPFQLQKAPENAIVLTEQEKTLLGMAEQTQEKLDKADFINKWVDAMRIEFKQQGYSIQRADVVYDQFYK